MGRLAVLKLSVIGTTMGLATARVTLPLLREKLLGEGAARCGHAYTTASGSTADTSRQGGWLAD